jgi:4-amino-4-deoxy-L-arabinose transferase-like glycosyltransferase
MFGSSELPTSAGRRAGDRRRDLLALTALALVARLPRLGESLWFDEAYYSTHEQFPSRRALLDSLASEVPAPLYRLLLFDWVELFGEHEVVVRLPSLLFGLLSIALTYELARRWTDVATARLAAGWLCLAPAHVWYSQEATTYAMVAFLVLAAALLAARAAEPGSSWRASGLYFGALLAALFTHYYALVALLPLSLLAMSAPERPRRRLLAANALAGAAVVAVFAAKRAAGHLQTGQAFLRPFDAFEGWMLGGQWFLHGNTLWPLSPYRASPTELAARPALLALQLAAAALLALGVRRAWRAGPPAHGRVLLAFLFVLPAALWAVTLAGYAQTYIERYVFWALPFYAIVIASGATACGGVRGRRAAGGFLLAVGVASYAGWLVHDDRWTVYKQNPDWRSAAADLAARAAPGRPVLVVGVAPTLALRYHVRRIGAAEIVIVRDDDKELLDRLSTTPGARKLFLVDNLYWPGDLYGQLAALEKDPRLRRTRVHAHRGVRLYEFVRRRAPRDPGAPGGS